MTYQIRDTYPGTGTCLLIDGVKYQIFMTDQAQYGSFATVIVEDELTGDRTYCNGIYENSQHRFIFRYEKEYNYNRNNWTYTGNLLVDVLWNIRIPAKQNIKIYRKED